MPLGMTEIRLQAGKVLGLRRKAEAKNLLRLVVGRAESIRRGISPSTAFSAVPLPRAEGGEGLSEREV